MAKINLPLEMLQKEAFKTLPAKEKEEYISNLMNKILQINPDGITISQVKEAAGLTSSTVWHHLEVLKSSTQCRKISHSNMDVYYPFGKMVHLDSIDKGKVLYEVSTVKNEEGDFVCIHELRESRLGSHKILRGIALPSDLIDKFVSILNKSKKSHLNIKK